MKYPSTFVRKIKGSWRDKNWLRLYDREKDYGGNWLKTLQRDDWRCNVCQRDLKTNRFVVHHKDETGIESVKVKSKVNNRLNNLISMCNSCHASLHRRAFLRRKDPELDDIDPSTIDIVAIKGQKTCSLCNRKHRAIGLCHMHYMRKLRAG